MHRIILFVCLLALTIGGLYFIAWFGTTYNGLGHWWYGPTMFWAIVVELIMAALFVSVCMDFLED